MRTALDRIANQVRISSAQVAMANDGHFAALFEDDKMHLVQVHHALLTEDAVKIVFGQTRMSEFPGEYASVLYQYARLVIK